MPPTTATDGTPVDPTAAALTRSIRQVETGGDYNASGKSGERGAYQWMPGNYEAMAKEAGLDPTDFSPVNQDKAAYHRVKSLLDQGYTQSQVASLWNSGSPDWQGKVGVNKEGIAYDVPAYVEKVKQAYLQQMGGQPQSGYVNPTQPQQNTPTGYGYVTPPAPAPPAPQAPIAQPEPDRGLIGNVLHGASGILAGAEKPFIGVGAIPVQAGVAAYNALTGSHIADPYAQGISAGIPGVAQKTQVTPLNLEKKAGDIAQVASYAVPGTEGAGLLAGAAGSGLLQGAGSAMSEGKGLADVAASGALGAGTNLALAGGAQALGTGVRALGDTASGAGEAKALQGIRDAYSSALNLNASERGFEARSGKDLAQVLMENQAPLGRYENGTLDASQAIPKLQAALEPLNEEANKIVSNPELNTKASNFISLDNIQKELESRIKSSNLDSLEKEKSLKSAQKLLDATRREYGDVVSPQVGEKIKQELQGSAFKKALTTSDALQKNTTYLASNVFKNNVEKAIGGDAGKAYRDLNMQRGDLVDAITRLTKLDGVRLLKGGRLGNIAAGAVGAISGAASGFGPFGVLAGDYFGTKAAEFLNNPATKIGVAQAKAKAAGLLPRAIGSTGKTVGKAVSGVGNTIQKTARPAGLLGNIMYSNNAL